jgi:hypothetical protein
MAANDLASIAAEIRKRQGRSSIAIVEIGALLNEASDALPHGDLMPWIEREFDFSYRTACRYRDVAMAVSNMPNWQIWTANLSKGALYAFVDLEDEVRVAVLEAALKKFVSASDVSDIAASNGSEADIPSLLDSPLLLIEDEIPAIPKAEPITVAPVISKIFKIAGSGWSPSDLAASVSESDLNFAIHFLQDIRRAQRPEIDPIKSAADRAELRGRKPPTTSASPRCHRESR